MDGGRQGAIDAEIESLYERISLLKAERNAMAPISVLPNELLSQIFGFCAADAFRSLHHTKWTRLIFVCKRWYELALASPTLWGYIYFIWLPSDRRILAQLNLSGAVPLTIRIGSVYSLDQVLPLLAHARRIESLDVGGDIGCILGLMHSMGHHDFPLLRSLSLIPRDEGVEEGPEVHPRLPPELLDGRMPRLSELTLSYIDAPWQSLPPLQSLSLKGRPHPVATETATHHPTFPVLLDVLRSSPQLHTLKLDMAIAPELHDRQCVPVHLPLLKLLHLCDTVTHCEDILAYVIFPATTRLELYPQGVNVGVDIRDILVPVRKHLRAPGAPTAKVLALQVQAHDDGDTRYFLATTYANTILPARLAGDVLFGINSHPADAPSLRQIMTKVLNAIPTQTITHLDAGAARFTIKSWKTALRLLPTVTSVSLDINDSATCFLESVHDLGYDAVSLRSLSLHSFLRSGVELEIVAPFFEALIRVLTEYHARGAPLERLLIKDYMRNLELGDATSAELGALVETVVMNGSGYW
ncbi:hypothetical protein B0H11DRAFT_1343373 [Mycena galericulata]|nr:hypothetical protein B0H11DRAFT_1343373 [Mycena galericulata]